MLHWSCELPAQRVHSGWVARSIRIGICNLRIFMYHKLSTFLHSSLFRISSVLTVY